MTSGAFHFGQREIHASDSNSLLRMYDLANQVLNSSKLQLERARADKAIQRITKELQKRQILF